MLVFDEKYEQYRFKNYNGEVLSWSHNFGSIAWEETISNGCLDVWGVSGIKFQKSTC
jgi:hypothetical protein